MRDSIPSPERIRFGLRWRRECAAGSAVVLVHGLNRTATDWLDRGFVEALWVNGALKNVDVLSFGYFIRPLPIDLESFPSVAARFLRWLQDYCDQYRMVVVVAHSAGCIVTREAIATAAKSNSPLLGKVKRCFLLDPPLDGSVFPWLLGPLRVLLGAKIRTLTPDSAYLTKLKAHLNEAARVVPPLFTPVYADFGGAGIPWRIQRLTLLDHLSVNGSVHSVAAFHGELPTPINILRTTEGSAEQSTLVCSIAEAVSSGQIGPTSGCLLCEFDELFMGGEPERSRYEAKLKQVLAQLSKYPDNGDLQFLRADCELNLRYLTK